MLRTRLFLAVVTLVALWTTVAIYLMRLQSGVKANIEPGISLSMKREGKGVRLTWNPGSLQASPYAVLRISDGKRKARIDLTNAAFQKGYILYTPESDEVLFTLALPQTGVSASLHTVTQPTQENPPQATTGISAVKSRPVSKTTPPKVLEQKAHQATLNTPALRVEAVPVIIQPRALAQDSQPQAISSDVDTPKLPTLGRSPTTVSLAPVPPSPWTKFFRRATTAQFLRPSRYKKSDQFVMAKPRRKVDPDVPKFIAEALTQESKVNLRVSVDRKGRVTDVEPLAPLPEHRLVGLASTAARKWEFEPARLRNRPVTSRVIISVTFRNPRDPGQ